MLLKLWWQYVTRISLRFFLTDKLSHHLLVIKALPGWDTDTKEFNPSFSSLSRMFSMLACRTWADRRRRQRLLCQTELEPTAEDEMGNTATKFRKALINGDELLACHLYESNQQFREALDPNSTYGESYQHNTPLHYAARHAMTRLLRWG